MGYGYNWIRDDLFDDTTFYKLCVMRWGHPTLYTIFNHDLYDPPCLYLHRSSCPSPWPVTHHDFTQLSLPTHQVPERPSRHLNKTKHRIGTWQVEKKHVHDMETLHVLREIFTWPFD